MLTIIRNNIVYLSILFLITCFFTAGIILQRSNKGDGKKRTVAGWMIFGGLWPLIDKKANRNLSAIEIIGVFVVLALIIGALIYTYFSTNGTFVW